MRPHDRSLQAAAQSCSSSVDTMIATVENDCVYANYVTREDKDAASVLRNMDATLSEDLEYQVTCGV